ncbi:MAG TPA: lactate racemase domain-containing protein, partial [Ktedonobacteraceae bacterium]
MNLHPFHDTPGMLGTVPMPDLALLRQRFPRPRVKDVSVEVSMSLERANVSQRLRPGARIAIAVGSRGIADIAPIARAVVGFVHQHGADPFIVPAMGSHGGATPEGQHSVLHSLGVTEEYTGAPIVSSSEVDELGTLPNGMPVYIDRNARGADGIIVVNRIKPHTDYKAAIESGISKMIAIGLGKQKGAMTVHSWGVEGLVKNVPEAAKFVVSHVNVLCGLAILENAYDEVAEIVALPPEDIGNEPEQRLLERAQDMMPRLPWDTLDVLVVDKLGKNISGAGMDPNIIGRMRCAPEQKPTAAQITNISVHDLTDESHGNAIGIGLADFTTARLIDKLDVQPLYINGLTAGVISMNALKIPIMLSTDRDAIAAAIRTSGQPDFTKVRLARVESTLQLGYVLTS